VTPLGPQFGSPQRPAAVLACADAASVLYPGAMELLSDDEISARLAALPGWERAGDSITTAVTRTDFRAALLYVGAVAYLAEAANHHPDILIQWNRVTLTLSTHSAGGLTAADFALADKISKLA
jgi:4a-hydroxytetrahydrobiopterin dehydratase